MNLSGIKYAYFLGIGGIGMSAIARYFNARGIKVAGYDKTPSDLTDELIREGIGITFEDDPDSIPSFIKAHPEETLLIYTPAIPADHRQRQQLLSEGRSLLKRSEVLGIISRDAYCIAVAGTHGKTTTSTLIAHILKSCDINFTAFLGGISANYGTNYLHHTSGRNLFAGKPVVVLEADEFDRSFHRLSPDIAVITAIDPDHLDIYGDEAEFRRAFVEFTGKIKPAGHLICQQKLQPSWPQGIQVHRYGTNDQLPAEFRSSGITTSGGNFYFDFSSNPGTEGNRELFSLQKIISGLPGFHNIENATAALGVCQILNLDADACKNAVETFRGAKRRFEYVVKSPQYVVIDDYAHHPEELNAIISSVKELYKGKKITGIFQPHLFTRTRDFADGFAESLSRLDEVILMDIYPARELPIEGISSSWLLGKIQGTDKKLMDTDGILKHIRQTKPEVLLILGAGDIDRIVSKVKEVYDAF